MNRLTLIEVIIVTSNCVWARKRAVVVSSKICLKGIERLMCLENKFSFVKIFCLWKWINVWTLSLWSVAIIKIWNNRYAFQNEGWLSRTNENNNHAFVKKKHFGKWCNVIHIYATSYHAKCNSCAWDIVCEMQWPLIRWVWGSLGAALVIHILTWPWIKFCLHPNLALQPCVY